MTDGILWGPPGADRVKTSPEVLSAWGCKVSVRLHYPRSVAARRPVYSVKRGTGSGKVIGYTSSLMLCPMRGFWYRKRETTKRRTVCAEIVGMLYDHRQDPAVIPLLPSYRAIRINYRHDGPHRFVDDAGLHVPPGDYREWVCWVLQSGVYIERFPIGRI